MKHNNYVNIWNSGNNLPNGENDWPESCYNKCRVERAVHLASAATKQMQLMQSHLEHMHSVQLMQHESINWLISKVNMIEGYPMPEERLCDPIEEKQSENIDMLSPVSTPPTVMEDDEYSNVFEATMEEGEIPAWYNQDETGIHCLDMEQLVTESAALEKFTLEEIEKLDYEIWKENNQPLEMPLREGQVESDKKGCLWVFTDCNDEPVWRQIQEGDSRYEHYNNIEKIQRATMT